MFPIKLIHLMKNNMKTLYFMRTHFPPKNIYFSIPGEEKDPKELPQIVSSIVFEIWWKPGQQCSSTSTSMSYWFAPISDLLPFSSWHWLCLLFFFFGCPSHRFHWHCQGVSTLFGGNFQRSSLKIDGASGDATLDLPLVALKCHEQQKP